MIHKKATIKYKGYNPDNLKSKSNKRICCVCDVCGRVRYVSKCDYRDLCHKCGNRTEKHCKKISDSRKKERKWQNEDNPNYNAVLTNGMYGKKHTEETKQLISINHADTSGEKNTQYGMKGEKSPNFGTHKTKETRIKISCGQRGIKIEDFEDFITFDPYCDKFNHAKRKEIRDKYNNCDYLTGIHRDICNKTKSGKIRELSVHHFDYNKMQGCNGYVWKLIPVSGRHNSMVNKNRVFWKKLILYALEYDKNYYKNEEFNIFKIQRS